MGLGLGLELDLLLCPETHQLGMDSPRCHFTMLTFPKTFSNPPQGLPNIKGFKARGSLGRCSLNKVPYSQGTLLEVLPLLRASSRGMGTEEQCLDTGSYLWRWDPMPDPETLSCRPWLRLKVFPLPQVRCVLLGTEARGCPLKLEMDTIGILIHSGWTHPPPPCRQTTLALALPSSNSTLT